MIPHVVAIADESVLGDLDLGLAALAVQLDEVADGEPQAAPALHNTVAAVGQLRELDGTWPSLVLAPEALGDKGARRQSP